MDMEFTPAWGGKALRGCFIEPTCFRDELQNGKASAENLQDLFVLNSENCQSGNGENDADNSYHHYHFTTYALGGLFDHVLQPLPLHVNYILGLRTHLAFRVSSPEARPYSSTC